jgi:hypothetical protein
MKLAGWNPMLSRPSPAIETLLAQERVIVPYVAIVRARALARARDALRAGDVMTMAAHAVPGLAHRLLFGAAAGIAVVATAAAAYQLLPRRTFLAPPRHAQPIHVLQYAENPAPAEVAVPPMPSTRPAVAAPATAPAGGPAKAPAATRSPEAIVVEELALLERAQQSVMRADYVAVLTVAAEHERRFPAGRLCEEREALRLRALIGLGRDRDARAAAVRFRRDFPRSVFLPRLDDMLAISR